MPGVPGAPGSGNIINTPNETGGNANTGPGGFLKGKGAAGAPDTSLAKDGQPNNTQSNGASSQMNWTWADPFDKTNNPNLLNGGTNIDGTSGDHGKGKGASEPSAFTAAGNQADKSMHPNVSDPFGTQKWSQDADGNWTLNQGFSGGLGDATKGLEAQAATYAGTPMDDGSAARDQAINAAYGQSKSRLDSQWGLNDSNMEAKLAAQGLDPNSQAYRTAMTQQSQGKNDAYSSAMNSAIGQGTAAGNAVFNNNLSQRNAVYSQLAALHGFLPNNGGANSSALQAQQAAANAQYQQQQIAADYAQAGASVVSSVAGASDARIKSSVDQFDTDVIPGVPYSEWTYSDDPSGQRYGGVIAQDLEKVAPDHVGEIGGVKHVSKIFAPQALGKAGTAAPAGSQRIAHPYTDPGDPLGAMTDEQLRKYTALGGLSQQDEDLQNQLAQAHALRNTHNSEGHRTGIAAALGGLSDVINGFSGRAKEDDIRKQRTALQGQQASGREDFYKLMRQQAQARALGQTRDAGVSSDMVPLDGGY